MLKAFFQIFQGKKKSETLDKNPLSGSLGGICLCFTSCEFIDFSDAEDDFVVVTGSDPGST